MNPYGCIVHTCPTKRTKGSGFCAKHKKEHAKIKFKIFKTNKEAGR